MAPVFGTRVFFGEGVLQKHDEVVLIKFDHTEFMEDDEKCKDDLLPRVFPAKHQ